MMKLAISLLAVAALAASSEAQDLGSYERILLPALATQPIFGANGAAFSTSFTMVNLTADILYFPSYANSTATPEVGMLPKGEFRNPYSPGPRSAFGRLLFIDRSGSENTIVAATLRSGPAFDEGLNRTRLPIVRERDFRTSTTDIIGVTSEYVYGEGVCRTATPRFRHTLRVYDVDAREDAQVLVRLFEQPVSAFPTPGREFVLTLRMREGSDSSYPTYAEATIPEICRPFSCHTPCFGGTQRVQIVPLTTGLRYWPMVSAIDNFTQQVSLAHP